MLRKPAASGAERARVALALLACAWFAGCSSLGFMWPGGSERIPQKLEAEAVPGALEKAGADLAAGRTERALDRMRAASNATDLAPELRDQVQRMIEQVAAQRIEELSQPGSDPEELAELLDLELPRQLAVAAGIRAARMLVEQGENVDAYELIKRVDTKFPLHHERVAASELLAEIGFALAKDESTILGMFGKRDDAIEVLEYLILNHPWSSRGDEAHAVLAQLYEKDRDWDLAIERNENLLLNHPNSPLRPRAQARIPQLRLKMLESPEYDRGALVRARKELEDWLAAYPGHEINSQVRVDLADCLRRMCESDLLVARFYVRVDNDYGARHHALRALEEAELAGDEGRRREVEELLADLPPAQAPAAEVTP